MWRQTARHLLVDSNWAEVVSPSHQAVSAPLLPQCRLSQPDRPVPLSIGLEVSACILPLVYQAQQLDTLCVWGVRVYVVLVWLWWGEGVVCDVWSGWGRRRDVLLTHEFGIGNEVCSDKLYCALWGSRGTNGSSETGPTRGGGGEREMKVSHVSMCLGVQRQRTQGR